MEGLDKDPRVKNWLEQFNDESKLSYPVKIYTMGLGKQVDRDLLKLVAVTTGGHSYDVADNGKLIDTFRELIWRLKGCWTKSLPTSLSNPLPNPLPASGREEDSMFQIYDMGILYYKNEPARSPRNFVALDGADELSFTRQGKQGAPLNGVDADGRVKEKSYTYVYYEQKGGGAARPFETLVTEWKPAASERRAYFSKRTVKPLFQLVGFARGNVPRYRPLGSGSRWI